MQFEQILATLKQANGEAELQSLLARMTLQPIETYKNSIQNQVKFTHEIVVLSHAFNNELDLLFEYIVQDAQVFKRFADDSYKIKIINSLFPGKNFVLLGCIVKLGYLEELMCDSDKSLEDLADIFPEQHAELLHFAISKMDVLARLIEYHYDLTFIIATFPELKSNLEAQLFDNNELIFKALNFRYLEDLLKAYPDRANQIKQILFSETKLLIRIFFEHDGQGINSLLEACPGSESELFNIVLSIKTFREKIFSLNMFFPFLLLFPTLRNAFGFLIDQYLVDMSVESKHLQMLVKDLELYYLEYIKKLGEIVLQEEKLALLKFFLFSSARLNYLGDEEVLDFQIVNAFLSLTRSIKTPKKILLLIKLIVDLNPDLDQLIFNKIILDGRQNQLFRKLVSYKQGLRDLAKIFLGYHEQLLVRVLENNALFKRVIRTKEGKRALIYLFDVDMFQASGDEEDIKFYYSGHLLSPAAIAWMKPLEVSSFARANPYNELDLLYCGTKPKLEGKLRKALPISMTNEPIFISKTGLPCPLSIIRQRAFATGNIEYFSNGSWLQPDGEELIYLIEKLDLLSFNKYSFSLPYPIQSSDIDLKYNSCSKIKFGKYLLLEDEKLKCYLRWSAVESVIKVKADMLHCDLSSLRDYERLLLLKYDCKDLLLCNNKVITIFFAVDYFAQHHVIKPEESSLFSHLDNASKKKLRDKFNLSKSHFFISRKGLVVSYEEAVSRSLENSNILALNINDQKRLYRTSFFKLLKQKKLAKQQHSDNSDLLLQEYKKQKITSPLPYLTRPGSKTRLTSNDIKALLDNGIYQEIETYLQCCYQYTKKLEKLGLMESEDHPSFCLLITEESEKLIVDSVNGTVKTCSPLFIFESDKIKIEIQNILSNLTSESACFISSDIISDEMDDELKSHPLILALIHYELRTYYPNLSIAAEELSIYSAVMYESLFSTPRTSRLITSYGHWFVINVYEKNRVSLQQMMIREGRLLDQTRATLDDHVILFLQQKNSWRSFLSDYIIQPHTKEIFLLESFVQSDFNNKISIAKHQINIANTSSYLELFSTNRLYLHPEIIFNFLSDEQPEAHLLNLRDSWRNKVEGGYHPLARNLFITEDYRFILLDHLVERAIHTGHIYSDSGQGFSPSDQQRLHIALLPWSLPPTRMLTFDEQLDQDDLGDNCKYNYMGLFITESLSCINLMSTYIANLFDDEYELVNPFTRQLLTEKDQQRLFILMPIFLAIKSCSDNALYQATYANQFSKHAPLANTHIYVPSELKLRISVATVSLIASIGIILLADYSRVKANLLVESLVSSISEEECKSLNEILIFKTNYQSSYSMRDSINPNSLFYVANKRSAGYQLFDCAYQINSQRAMMEFDRLKSPRLDSGTIVSIESYYR